MTVLFQNSGNHDYLDYVNFLNRLISVLAEYICRKKTKKCRKILTGVNMLFISMEDFEVNQIYSESVVKEKINIKCSGILSDEIVLIVDNKISLYSVAG